MVRGVELSLIHVHRTAVSWQLKNVLRYYKATENGAVADSLRRSSSNAWLSQDSVLWGI